MTSETYIQVAPAYRRLTRGDVPLMVRLHLTATDGRRLSASLAGALEDTGRDETVVVVRDLGGDRTEVAEFDVVDTGMLDSIDVEDACGPLVRLRLVRPIRVEAGRTFRYRFVPGIPEDRRWFGCLGG